MKSVLSIAVALSAAMAFASPIDEAIAKGAKYLLSKQAEDGHWSDGQMPALTALPVWALAGCRETPAEAVEKGVKFVLAARGRWVLRSETGPRRFGSWQLQHVRLPVVSVRFRQGADRSPAQGP